MTSLATAQLEWLVDRYEASPEYPSAVFSGIVPDAAHLANGGYHVSIEDLIRFGNAGDYSNTRALDKAPPVTGAGTEKGSELSCAVDMSLSKADMVKLYGRVKRVWQDLTDPRRKWINAWNVWNGVEGNRPDRFNFQTNSVSKTDVSHEWHTHKDFPRAYVDFFRSAADAWMAVKAAWSIAKGETKEEWLAMTQPATDPFQNKSRYASADAAIRTQDQKIHDMSQALGYGVSYNNVPYWIRDQIEAIAKGTAVLLSRPAPVPVDEDAIADAVAGKLLTDQAFIDQLAAKIAAATVIPTSGTWNANA